MGNNNNNNNVKEGILTSTFIQYNNKCDKGNPKMKIKIFSLLFVNYWGVLFRDKINHLSITVS